MLDGSPVEENPIGLRRWVCKPDLASWVRQLSDNVIPAISIGIDQCQYHNHLQVSTITDLINSF